MPKKVRKAGGGGGGGRTEEERLLYLQQRAQAEEDMAKKKEEILTLFLKDKLQKEEKNTCVNLLKLNEGWRSILRQSRSSELRRDVVVLGQTFERQLDGLDNVIKNLERDLQEAERQSAQVRRVHLSYVERLWAQQDKQLTVLRQQWDDCLQHLSSRFDSERKQMLSRSQDQRVNLDDSEFTLEQQHQDVMRHIHTLYNESITAHQSAHEDRRAALVLDNTAHNQEALQLHSRETRDLGDLVLRNQRYKLMIDRDVKKVRGLQDVIIQLRVNLSSSKSEKESAEQDLAASINQVNRRTHRLRHQLTQGHSAARKQLAVLTAQSDKAVKKLQAVIVEGERVLRVAEMCRKLERENAVASLGSAADHHPPVTEEQQKESSADLRPLTRRVNVALLRRETLIKSREDLSRENRRLRLLLRQHLDATTVSDGGLHAPLLAVRRAPSATAAGPVDRHHSVIEAVHAVKHSL